VSEMLKQYKSKHITEAMRVRKAELCLTMCLVEHNLPFLFMDHLPKLLTTTISDSEIVGKIKCSRTKTVKLVHLLKEEAQKEMISQLQSCKCSLIIDETTDISVTKCLAIVVRYVENYQRVQDKLLTLVEPLNCTAEGITTSVLSALRDFNIPVENIIGYPSDNCSVMMGDIGGVKAKLQTINPNIFVMGCICHSMHLCASYAAKKLPSNVEQFVRDIYNYISRSSNRMKSYKEFQVFVDLKPHKLLKLGQTRWLSLEVSLPLKIFSDRY
jgi:hypothetical protein